MPLLPKYAEKIIEPKFVKGVTSYSKKNPEIMLKVINKRIIGLILLVSQKPLLASATHLLLTPSISALSISNFFKMLSTCVQKYIKKYGIRESLKTHISNHIQYYF